MKATALTVLQPLLKYKNIWRTSFLEFSSKYNFLVTALFSNWTILISLILFVVGHLRLFPFKIFINTGFINDT